MQKAENQYHDLSEKTGSAIDRAFAEGSTSATDRAFGEASTSAIDRAFGEDSHSAIDRAFPTDSFYDYEEPRRGDSGEAIDFGVHDPSQPEPSAAPSGETIRLIVCRDGVPYYVELAGSWAGEVG